MCAVSLPVSEGPAFESLPVTGNIVGQELERGKTIKARVLRLVHRAHPAAQFLDDAVVGKMAWPILKLQWLVRRQGKSMKANGFGGDSADQLVLNRHYTH